MSTTAVSNAKQVFLLLIEFDQDFGEFPSDATAKSDKDLKGYKGKYSNDYLAQFIAGGYTSSEEIFYAKGGSGSKKRPDDLIKDRSNILSEGECGFAYIKDLNTRSNTNTPILLAPMYGDGYKFSASMTGKGYKFNAKTYNGLALVLRIDGAVKHYPIDENGDAILPNGKKLFEGGKGSVWGNKGPNAKNLLFPK